MMSGWGILIRYYYPVDLLTMPYYQGGSSLCGDLVDTYSSTAEGIDPYRQCIATRIKSGQSR